MNQADIFKFQLLNEFSPKMPENFGELTERDKLTLEYCGRNILQKIQEDFPEGLPELVLFADVSARPLVYVFGPALYQIAKSRGVKPPVLDTINIQKGSDYDIQALHTDSNKTEYFDFEDLLRQENTKKRDKLFNQHNLTNPEIILIDEFLSNGTTAREFLEVFGYNSKVYILLKSNCSRKTLKNIFCAFYNPYPSFIVSDGFRYPGFDYREMYKYEVLPYDKHVGHDVYEVIGSKNPFALARLYQGMLEIGLKLADEIK
jgi:hypothetical protein